MADPSVSVVVVSRERPAALMRCLDGLAQLDYPQYEIICVACPAGDAALSRRDDAALIKRVVFDEANISVARNLGIAESAGEIVAFIDDDAVPEPLWLRHLAAPFSEPEVAATGGYVIGRNGISFQWKARGLDREGEAHDLDLNGDQPVVLHPQPDRAIKTEGTNMAVRRDVLTDVGGFDPAFRFYLDESDLNRRLADLGLATAIVPLAQVHHGFAESERRHQDRTPRDLSEIGASKAVFLRKHLPEDAHARAWAEFQTAQRKRLLAHMQTGALDPLDVARLMRGLRRGYRAGMARTFSDMPAIPHAVEGFRPYPGRPDAPRLYLAGRVWQNRLLRRKARQALSKGTIVSLCLLSPTIRFHRVRFTEDGFWEHRGGRFGKSTRDMPLWKYWRFSARRKFEQSRVELVRGQGNDTIG